MIIHQIWWQGEKSIMPKNWLHFRDTVMEFNPDAEFKLHSSEDNLKVVKAVSPKLLDIYKNFPKEIFRSDLARILHLFSEGGIYADLDTEALSNWSGFIKKNDVSLGAMTSDKCDRYRISNSMMASPKYHVFWLSCLDEIIQRHNLKMDPDYVTGPAVITEIVRKYELSPEEAYKSALAFYEKYVSPDVCNKNQLIFGGVKIFDPVYIYPLSIRDNVHKVFYKLLNEFHIILPREISKKLFPNSIAVTYCSHMWNGRSLKNKIKFVPAYLIGLILKFAIVFTARRI